MKRSTLRAITFVVLLSLSVSAVDAPKRSKIEIVAPKTYSAPKLEPSAKLQTILDVAVNDMLRVYADGSFKNTEIAATLIDVHEPSHMQMASIRGDERIYPASVVKMFYMNALERQLEDGKVTMPNDLARGLRDMIVASSNEATQYILNVLTDTSSGAELPQKE